MWCAAIYAHKGSSQWLCYAPVCAVWGEEELATIPSRAVTSPRIMHPAAVGRLDAVSFTEASVVMHARDGAENLSVCAVNWRCALGTN
jgi:hypothetical protein